jgi:hypothetical protein
MCRTCEHPLWGVCVAPVSIPPARHSSFIPRRRTCSSTACTARFRDATQRRRGTNRRVWADGDFNANRDFDLNGRARKTGGLAGAAPGMASGTKFTKIPSRQEKGKSTQAKPSVRSPSPCGPKWWSANQPRSFYTRRERFRMMRRCLDRGQFQRRVVRPKARPGAPTVQQTASAAMASGNAPRPQVLPIPAASLALYNARSGIYAHVSAAHAVQSSRPGRKCLLPQLPPWL